MTKLLLMLAFASRREWECPPVAGQPRRKLGLCDTSCSWDRELMGRLLRFGWPSAVSSMAEAASFCIIVVLVGKLGEIPMAATTLALGVNMIAFIPMYGLGQAVGVLVGQRLTSHHADLAKRSVRSGLMIGIAYSSLFALAYGLIPHQVLNVYAWGTEPARFEEMRPIVVPLL
ncbi:MAG: MATE family efflux transporter, partial [Pirellulaceae bacterium]